jgi:cytochrome c
VQQARHRNVARFFSKFLTGLLMRKTLSVLLFLGFIFSAKLSYAEVAQLNTLMQRNNCLACHMIDKRKYGPHMKEVAAKYAGSTDMVDQLAAKIKAGGTGVWGADIMPPQAQVTDENAKLMAKLILALDTK